MVPWIERRAQTRGGAVWCGVRGMLLVAPVIGRSVARQERRIR